ncbi:MAG: hypothetical protein DMG81_12945 [Acidobacteria bacterium]|nr:MAG: hypothetical protein DMG81_12945 [Acidobacteriota bacterium]
MQILISNYEIPANYHSRDMQPPAGALPKNTPLTDFLKVKSIPARTNIHYKNNGGSILRWKACHGAKLHLPCSATD